MPAESNSINNIPKTYLALGDSYTIGEAVKQEESFPFQLQKKLNAAGFNIAEPKIIATTGWTTDELIQAIKLAELTEKFDFVTLLIGVNNQYRGYAIETFKKDFSELLKTTLHFANGNQNKIFVVSIPDWGVTPFGINSGKDLAKIAMEIDQYNAISKALCQETGISFTDITTASRKAKEDISLTASDGLHPSAVMYSDWTKLLYTTLSLSLK